MKVAQSSQTLCDPWTVVHGILQVRIAEWVALPLKGSPNPGLPHCRWIIYQLSHKGSPSYVTCDASQVAQW